MNNDEGRKVRNILVIGANGGIGRQTVDLALKAGHRVTAVLRNPANLPVSDPNLEVVKGDIMLPGSFEGYLAGKDAVISAIGAKSTGPTTVYSQGNRNLLDAMKKRGVRRAFFISASALDISPVLPFYARFLAKYILQKILRNMYDDQRIMERLVKESDADWTIVRPPRLTNGKVTGRYRFACNVFLKNALSISRGDVAHFMIHNLDNEGAYKATVEIGY